MHNGDMMREQWGTQTGFVLASIGAAVGLGNIWRFSYVAGENGGAAFLLAYLLCITLVGVPLIIAELALGRRARGDAIAAFASIAPHGAWRGIGLIAVAAAFLILSYYAVIAGWAARYLAGALTGVLWVEAERGYGAYFEQFIAGTAEPVLWQAVMMAATVLIVAGGVRRGIERISRILLPALGLMVIGLAAHAVTLPDGGAGLRFLFAPEWDALLAPKVYLAALGQAFFSLGIGMAILITYGSYLAPQQRIPAGAWAVAGGDTLFAVLAGVAIFPAVFALGFDPAAGPQLAFVTLPQIFLALPLGHILGAVFFLLLVVAALTSMVSLLEVSVSCVTRRWSMSRPVAAVMTGVLITITGIPSALSYGLLEDVRLAGRPLLDATDFLVSDLALPVSGLLTALFVGWRWRAEEVQAAAGFRHDGAARVWLRCLRVATPGLILLVLVQALFRL